jgi:hypothetical protein
LADLRKGIGSHSVPRTCSDTNRVLTENIRSSRVLNENGIGGVPDEAGENLVVVEMVEIEAEIECEASAVVVGWHELAVGRNPVPIHEQFESRRPWARVRVDATLDPNVHIDFGSDRGQKLVVDHQLGIFWQDCQKKKKLEQVSG